MRFATFLIILFLSFGSIWAIDLNKTIIDANVTIYQNLLKDIPQDKNLTSKESLEKTLLTMLVKPQKLNIKDINFSQINDEKEYKKAFIKYLDDVIMLNNLKNQTTQFQEKINTIEEQIKALKSGDSSAISMQLQDAFYHKKLNLLNQKISFYKNQIKKIKNLLVESLKNITFTNENIDKDISKKEALLKKYHNDIAKLEVQKERFEFISKQNEITKIDKKIKKIQETYEDTLKDIVASKFIEFSFAIKTKDEKAFAIAKDIKQKLNQLKINNIDTDFMPLIQSMEKKYLGTLKIITGNSKQELKDVIYKSWEFINQPIFEINKTPISIFKLSLALFIFILGFVVGALYKRKIKNISSTKTMTSSTKTLLANIGYYIIITIAFFISLKVLGVTLSSLAFVAGALSVGIGFGLQNVVSNLVSGLIIMFEKSIKIGDYIELSEDLRGYVTDIKMRSTTINTNDNIDVIVPNQNFIQNNVINWTMNDRIRRFKIPFGVKYGTDVHYVIDIIKDAVKNSGFKDIYEDDYRKTRVIMTEMGDSSLNFELFVWIKGNEMKYPKRTTSRFLILIYDTLNKHNIEIPFPQRDLHIRSIEATLPIKNSDSF